MRKAIYVRIPHQKNGEEIYRTTRLDKAGTEQQFELIPMMSPSITIPPDSSSSYDNPYGSDALGPTGTWSKNYSKEGGRHDEISLPAQHLEPSVWSFSAKLFIALITLFVATTSVPLIVIMHLQYTGSKTFGDHFSNTSIWANWLLQPQAILSELVLLGTAIHAIRTRNMIAIILVLCFNIYLVIAGFLEAAQRRHDLLTYKKVDGSIIPEFYITNILLWTVPALDLCFHIGCDWSALKLYRELGWLAYKKSSADLALGKLYHNVLILRSMALFSTVFAFLEFYTVAVLTLAGYRNAMVGLDVPPQPGNIVGANVSVAVLVGCWTFGALPLYLGMKKESRKLLNISLGVQTLGMAAHYASLVIALGLLTTVVNKEKEKEQDNFVGAQANQWKTYFQYAIISLLFLLNFIWSVLVLRGFGKGLKEREESQVQGVRRRTIEELDLSA